MDGLIDDEYYDYYDYYICPPRRRGQVNEQV